MSIKKQYLKGDGICKVTFSLKEKVNSIDTVRIPAEFNDWDTNCEPMKKLKTGGFSQTICLKTGKGYQFKYLINDSVWANDPDSDEFVSNYLGDGNKNSMIFI